MELSPDTLALLRDEAYAFLCGEALRQQLAILEREKTTLASTRPPFGGLLARKETRAAFEHSMRTALDNEAALRDRLVQIEGIEARLRPALRHDLADFLAALSPEYCRFPQIAARLYDWEQSFHALPELLLAFARDARSVRLAAATPGATRQSCVPELAVLRDIAGRLERQNRELLVIEQTVVELTPAGAEKDIHLPALPDFSLVGWVGRLTLSLPAQIVPELARVESLVRNFLAHGAEAALARLQATREACAWHENLALEQYWNQLRQHARTHYVEERDVDEVLKRLVQTYVEADFARRQRTFVRDPFISER